MQRLIGSKWQPMGGGEGGAGGDKVTGMAIRESHRLAAGGGERTTRQGLTCVYWLFVLDERTKGIVGCGQ